MPQYDYRCDRCEASDAMLYPIGTAPRDFPCECSGMYRLVIGAGVNIAPSALETKGENVRDINAKEGRWEKDMPAYKRMRHQGLQPDQIDGAERLEDTVGDQFDIKYQKLYEMGVSRERVQEGAEQAQLLVHDGVPL